MCGRYTVTVTAQKIWEHYRLVGRELNLRPRYNIAPGQAAPVVISAGGQPQLSFMNWGMAPPRHAGSRLLINARAETIDQKPSFKNAFRYRRCLVIADSYFEWQKTEGKKQPWRIIFPGQQLIAFAGIWNAGGGGAARYCIITTAAAAGIAHIHHRMPAVISNPDEEALWLQEGCCGSLAGLLQPFSGLIDAYRVSAAVNSPANDTPACLEKLDGNVTTKECMVDD